MQSSHYEERDRARAPCRAPQLPCGAQFAALLSVESSSFYLPITFSLNGSVGLKKVSITLALYKAIIVSRYFFTKQSFFCK